MLAWSPTRVNVEKAFGDFVRTFRSGQLISELMPASSLMPLNADYVFPNDDVVAELKTLEEDGASPLSYAKRMAAAFRSRGLSGSSFFGWLYRGEPVPPDVSHQLYLSLRRPIVSAVRKANKQLRASKRFLNRPSGKGIVLVANSNNYGLTPTGAFKAVCDAALALEDNHVDALVYFTPNVYHRTDDSGIAMHLWVPSYRGDDQHALSEFVNDLGRKWGDYFDRLVGEPSLVRSEISDLEEGDRLLTRARPIDQFKKPSGVS